MFKTYNASAGSGKTTNLVAEYLTICLQNPTENFRHVLAVTFTNNATAEMKDRIIHTLNDFAFTEPATWDFWEEQTPATRKQLGRSHFIHKTTQRLSGLDSQTIRDRSETLLENILARYPDFAVSTIDSFFQRIVRSFAFDLGLSLDFNVEVTLDDYFQQTVDLLYQQISGKKKEGKELARRVIELMEQKMEEKGHWRIDNDLLSLLNDIYYDEQAPQHIDLLEDSDFKAATSLLSDIWRKNTTALQDLVNQAKDIVRNSGIDESDFPQRDGLVTWLNKLSPFGYNIYQKLENAISEGTSFTKKGKRDLNAAEREAIIRLKSQIETLIDGTLKPCHAVQNNFKKIKLLFDLQRIMEELRLQDNKFFLSETGQLIQKEIKGNPVPYIYNKVGTRFSHYFIDEFQDTSDTQWENLLPLLDEAVSNNGNAILFGDVKQAIYRFRNGNPQLFAELVKTGSDRRRHFERLTRCEEQQLDSNHRTCLKIIDFNNRFFSELPTLPAFPERLRNFTAEDFYRDFYAAVQQKPFKKEEGFVAVHFRPDDNNNVETNEEYLANATLQAIADARNRGYQLRDIAVLTRQVAVGTFIGKTLSDNNIPVISADSLVVGSCANVRLIIAMMRHIATPSDPLARFQLLHLLLNRDGRSDELVKFMDQLEEASFRNLLVKEFGITVNRRHWASLPLITLVHTLVRELGLQAPNSYVVEFIDLVNDYGNTYGNSLGTFLEWWKQKGASKAVTSPENIDAVKIMTIHKAKGKEFPVVIMPVLNKVMTQLTKPKVWQPLDTARFGLPTMLLQKSEAMDTAFGTDDYAEECALTALDEANVLYVGQTRPEEALYLIVDKKRTSRPTKNPNGSAAKFNYSLLLEDFINNNEGEFTEKENWFWFGDAAHQCNRMTDGAIKPTTDNKPLPIAEFSHTSLIPAEIDTEKQEIGIVVHSYFEKLTHFPQSEAEAEQWTFEEGQTYQEEIRAALKSLTRNSTLLPYFTDGLTVLTEVNILTESGERRRPDRVVQLEEETVVIDFKTGEPTEAMREKYRAQVDEYVRILQEMGFPNVRGELLYL